DAPRDAFLVVVEFAEDRGALDLHLRITTVAREPSELDREAEVADPLPGIAPPGPLRRRVEAVLLEFASVLLENPVSVDGQCELGDVAVCEFFASRLHERR